jgi:hypothetical protein
MQREFVCSCTYWWRDMEVDWKLKYMLQGVHSNSAVKFGVWIVIHFLTLTKWMAPGHITTVPSMASLATVDTSSSLYAPTQLLNWVYLTLADQNSAPPTTDPVPVSSTPNPAPVLTCRNRCIKIFLVVDRCVIIIPDCVLKIHVVKGGGVVQGCW